MHRVAPLRVHDVRLAAEHAAVEVERDEEGVRAIGDVLDDAGCEADEPGVVVHRGIEAAAARR